jgi:pyruvyl transferase EpsO
LKRAVADTLDRLIPKGSRCALVDFPAHPNVGDSAIWLGERAYLRGRGVTVAYTCDLHNYSRKLLDRALGDGPILIHGGGNFGDLWPHHHALRLRVLRHFRDRRIIQLPQTVYFRASSALDETKRAIDDVEDFVMVVRDRHSADKFVRDFGRPCHVAPDMALFLGPQAVPGRPSVDVFWLSRTDKESLAAPTHDRLPNARAADWLDDDLGVHWLTGIVAAARRRTYRAARLEQSLYDAVAHARLRRGYRLLRQGRVVVTERLHGHILCVLGGIPHVLIDNNYGKNSTFFDTWTRGWPEVRFATSLKEASLEASELLRESNVRRMVAS